MSWALWLVVALPLAGAGLVLATAEPRRWTWIGRATSVGTLLIVLILAALDPTLGTSRSGTGWVLAVNAAICATVSLAHPLRNRLRRDVYLPLLWLTTNTVALTVDDARALLLAWMLVPMVGWFALAGPRPRDGRARQVVAVYLVGGSVPLVVACLIFAGYARAAGITEPFSIARWNETFLPAPMQSLVFLLVVAATAVRLAVVPLHSWFPALIDTTHVGTALSFTGVQMAVHVMIRLALAPLPNALDHELALVSALGLFGALYGAVLAVSQHQLRRLVALVTVSQSGALLVGLASSNLVSISGAMTNAISVAVTLKCLQLATAALEARVGPVDIRQMGGYAKATPRLATSAILIALAAAGMPGSLAFVGEDLILQGILRPSPLAASLLLLAAALNAIALLRAMMRAFLGGLPPSWARSTPDLFARETMLVAMAVLLLVLGIHPKPLIEAHHDDAQALVGAASAPGGHGSAPGAAR